MREPHLTRRLLLAGIGSAAVATGLSGCDQPPDKPSPPAQADQPRRATPRPTLRTTPKINEALLRRKIASLLVVGFRGDTVGKNDWIMEAIRSGLGGVILFDRELHTNAPRNITSPKQVTSLIKTLQNASPGRRLIVSVDQEGGQIARLNPSDGFPATKSEADIGAANSTTTTRNWANGMVQHLAASGFTLNYAPVVDLNVNPDSPAIGALDRSFSADPGVVVSNASEEIRVHRGARVKTSLKHFPGLGSATGNTDFDVVDVSATWSRTELQPYQQLISSGLADSVLVTHVLNDQLDASLPASLSPAVVTNLLRGQLRFKGPVVSDDMQAVAISSKFGRDQSVAMALAAGLDLLVFGNQEVFDPNIVDETLDNVVNLVRQGHLTEAHIDQSVTRVNTLRPKD
ncbi:glycoside hydrolase family 3 protein [Rugosimonospora acidiphila]|uniref:beta-N-acetylhexosaminidase n=1 Tax=Rugosimonospora acidiphila TaxID=556531 RepID=A0ABP9SPW0_9ACTN